ncbi:MAG: oligosaccharide flippase family protein [Alphaproteobacteria bacterium]|nr:oligosaccharide flippase family protein [Alphaproteobacteria bacterium]
MASPLRAFKDVSIAFATTAYIQVINIATGLLAARLLLPEGRGELAELMLWPGLIAELGCLALSDALLYRIASRAGTPRILAGTITWLALGLCLVLAPLGIALIPWTMASNHGDVRQAAYWYTPIFFVVYFASLFAANMFQGALDLKTWNLVRAIVPTCYLAGILVLASAIAAEAPEFAAANLVAMGLSALVGIALLRRRGWFGLRPDRGEARAMLVYGAKSHASEILHSLRQKLDQVAVAALMTASDLGLYAVALTVANGPLILVQTVSNIAFPKISAQETHGGKVEVFGKYLRLALAMVVAINIVLWIANAWIIPLLFGRPFAAAVLVADVMLLGLVPYTAKLLFSVALKAFDRALAIPRAELWGLAFVAPALFALVPRYGLYGAAASLVMAQVVSALVLGQRLARELDVHPLQLMRPTVADLAFVRSLAQRVTGRG